MPNFPTARISAALTIVALLALAAVAAQRFRAARADRKSVAASQAEAPRPLDVRRLPPRQGSVLAPSANEAGNRGGPWYVICSRHVGGYCSDPYTNFDVAMARAEAHRTATRHLGVGVSTACPF